MMAIPTHQAMRGNPGGMTKSRDSKTHSRSNPGRALMGAPWNACGMSTATEANGVGPPCCANRTALKGWESGQG